MDDQKTPQVIGQGADYATTTDNDAMGPGDLNSLPKGVELLPDSSKASLEAAESIQV